MHVYQDNRTDKSYIPSVKPYLWMKYLEEDSSRENGSYFYLDSDVLLREIPKVRPTKKMWYASDCTGYIGNQYIDSKGERLLEDMCRAIGIDHLSLEKKIQLVAHNGRLKIQLMITGKRFMMILIRFIDYLVIPIPIFKNGLRRCGRNYGMCIILA
ncbi:hypothetical protein [Gracilibacillus sp. JCM 18860]|uniref:hypothetical protein n=1 Tax=Gracilibacillus sp. JCM 18860 TaxID=1306159 RepID=UPI0032619DE1